MKNKTYRKHQDTNEISVIIPAHNAEKTLRRAVESVCRELALLSGKGKGALTDAGGQESGTAADASLSRFEVLIIENGSEDGTEFLARTLELEHPEAVRFLRSEKGVSNARNRGLEEAKGTWILFLDADDYLLEGAGNVLLNDLHFTGTDLIVHSYEAGNRIVHVCGPEGERYSGKSIRSGARESLSGGRDPAGDAAGAASGKKPVPEKAKGKEELSQTGLLEEIIVRMIEDPTRYTAVWSKLFRRERIEYGRLRFDPGLRLSEDSHFLIRYLFLCRRIRLSDRPVYHYSTDNSSVVRAWDGKKEEGYREALYAVRSCLQTQPVSVRQAFAAYGMMQFNLLMVREVFSLDSPDRFPQKIRRMKEIKESGPFAEAFSGFDQRRHKGARYLPIRLLKRGLYPAAAAVYEARVMQNARKERR